MQDPIAFADAWCAAWNAHDVEGVLMHFHDDVVFSSPLAARLLPETGGVLAGKPALRAYWLKGVALHPGLAFTVEAVFAGIGALTILYRNETGRRTSEVLVFAGDRVKAGYATALVEA